MGIYVAQHYFVAQVEFPDLMSIEKYTEENLPRQSIR